MKSNQINDTLEKYNKLNSLTPIFNYIEICDTRVDINRPIYAFCGLNGSKKTTTILSIAKMFSSDVKMEDGLKLICKTKIDDKDYDNMENINKNLVDNSRFFLYTNDLVYKYKKFSQQRNLSELLEQYDPFEFKEKDVSNINFYLGKSYKKVTVIAVEDEEDYNLYFEIEAEEKYNNSTMGTGELVFLILYYIFHKYENALIILDEPEMFLSIPTQRKIMNLFRTNAIEKKDTIIYSTHSFFLLEDLELTSISYISNIGKIAYTIPSNDIECNLMGKDRIFGTIFFEDTKGLLFFQALLSKFNKNYLITHYNLMQISGSGNICNELKRINGDKIKYNFIGVFDGDKKNDHSVDSKSFNWPYVFLPLSINLEEAIRNDYQKKTVNYNSYFNISSDSSTRFIDSHQGSDCHDWFEDFVTKFPSADNKSIINYYVSNANESEKNEFKLFVENFEKIIESSSKYTK